MKSGFWKKLILAVVIVLIFAIGIHLSSRLPPPKITLQFQGFKTIRTKTYATLCFSNAGENMVWWTGVDFSVESETAAGWTTNHPSHFTTSPYAVLASSNELAWVMIPQDAIRWRVRADYQYYDHHHVRFEFFEWLIRKKFYNDGKFWDAIGAILRVLPEPEERYGEASTAILTNRAPPLTNSANAAPNSP